MLLGEDVIEIARLRLADGQPMAFETRYLAYKTLPGAARRKTWKANRSITC